MLTMQTEVGQVVQDRVESVSAHAEAVPAPWARESEALMESFFI